MMCEPRGTRPANDRTSCAVFPLPVTPSVSQSRQPHQRSKHGLRCGLTGVSLVELLVALAVVGVMLGFVGQFFATQSRAARDQQARNELNVALRTVVETVAQDFQLAGSRAAVAVDNSGATYVGRIDEECSDGGDPPLRTRCVVLDDPDGLTVLSIFYASSTLLLPNESVEDGLARVCRRVTYVFDDDEQVLYRADAQCSEALDLAAVQTFAFEFMRGVDAFVASFTCSDDADVAVDDAESCYEFDIDQTPPAASRFVREGRIEVAGASTRNPDVTATVGLSAAMPNMRPPFTID